MRANPPAALPIPSSRCCGPFMALRRSCRPCSSLRALALAAWGRGLSFRPLGPRSRPGPSAFLLLPPSSSHGLCRPPSFAGRMRFSVLLLAAVVAAAALVAPAQAQGPRGVYRCVQSGTRAAFGVSVTR